MPCEAMEEGVSDDSRNVSFVASSGQKEGKEERDELTSFWLFGDDTPPSGLGNPEVDDLIASLTSPFQPLSVSSQAVSEKESSEVEAQAPLHLNLADVERTTEPASLFQKHLMALSPKAREGYLRVLEEAKAAKDPEEKRLLEELRDHPPQKWKPSLNLARVDQEVAEPQKDSPKRRSQIFTPRTSSSRTSSRGSPHGESPKGFFSNIKEWVGGKNSPRKSEGETESQEKTASKGGLTPSDKIDSE